MISISAAILAMALGGSGGNSGETVLLDFSAPWCGPCRQMEPAVKQLVARGYPVRKVDFDAQRALATQYQVNAIPCFVMLVDGQEVDRIVGHTSQRNLELLVETGLAKRGPRAQIIAGTANPARVAIPSVVSAAPLVDVAKPARDEAPAAGTSTVAAPQAPAVSQELIQKLLAATVRLRIDDGSGRSVGSGTIIDARSGEALILTCGHVFRDSQGKGKIVVDLFGPGAQQGVPARLVAFDLKSDLGFLSIELANPASVAPLASADFRVQPHDAVVTVGCSHGADPTAESSQVTKVDKYLGASNVEVAGQPVEGRSGGGLFTADGRVIGVCNAADPADNEGLYAALPAIYAELGRLGLDKVLVPGAEPSAPLTATAALADNTHVPAMPEQMPGPNETAAAHLNPDEAKLLGQLRDKTEGAEVICIVRSLADPRAKSEIIVLDRASPAFLESLAADSERQASRRLTSMAEQPTAAPPMRTASGLLWKPQRPIAR
jgi:thiol-disulfide isomerase/thioredoxin